MKIVFAQMRNAGQVPDFVIARTEQGELLKFEAATLAHVMSSGFVKPVFYAESSQSEAIDAAWKVFTTAEKGGVSSIPALQSWFRFVQMRSWGMRDEIDFEKDKKAEYFECLNECFASRELLEDRASILPTIASFYSAKGPSQALKQKTN